MWIGYGLDTKAKDLKKHISLTITTIRSLNALSKVWNRKKRLPDM